VSRDKRIYVPPVGSYSWDCGLGGCVLHWKLIFPSGWSDSWCVFVVFSRLLPVVTKRDARDSSGRLHLTLNAVLFAHVRKSVNPLVLAVGHQHWVGHHDERLNGVATSISYWLVSSGPATTQSAIYPDIRLIVDIRSVGCTPMASSPVRGMEKRVPHKILICHTLVGCF